MKEQPVGVTFIRYEWAVGTSDAGLKAEDVGREFERMTDSGMLLVPEAVVDESRPDDAALHDYFEWRDPVGAELWRKEQARYLIRSVVRVPIRNDTEEELPPIRAFVSVLNDAELGEGFEPVRLPGVRAPRHYMPIDEVMSTQDLRDEYRRQAFRKLMLVRERYHDLEEFSRIFEAIDALKEQFELAA